MFSRAEHRTKADKASTLTLGDLIAIQPRHLRGQLTRGTRGPDGERPGRGRAQTLDFDGLSPYLPGDDVRTIDWRASLRSGQTTVRRFAAASHRARVLVLDLRPDLYFGTQDRIMAKTACLIAAWLIWSSQILHEPVGLVSGPLSVPARRGRRHGLRLLDEIVAAFDRGAEATVHPPDLDQAATLVGRHDEICLISDIPADTTRLITAGRALSTARILKFFAIDDPFVRDAPRPGRYPVRGADGTRQVLHVRRSSPHPDRRSHDLMDAGWRVAHALDLLPQGLRT